MKKDLIINTLTKNLLFSLTWTGERSDAEDFTRELLEIEGSSENVVRHIESIDYRPLSKEMVVTIGNGISRTTMVYAAGDRLIYNPHQPLYPLSKIIKSAVSSSYLRPHPKDFACMMMLFADIQGQYADLAEKTYYELIDIGDMILYRHSQLKDKDIDLLDFFHDYIVSNYTAVEKELVYNG